MLKVHVFMLQIALQEAEISKHFHGMKPIIANLVASLQAALPTPKALASILFQLRARPT